MGACIVNGLNNWDRVARLRSRMEDARGAPFDDGEWAEAFREVIPQKTLYQDRVIILEPRGVQRGAGSGPRHRRRRWRARSVAIRREHECTHYFTLVAFGVMRNNLLDEFLADFAGLARTYSRYDASLALRFLGLEAYPDYRTGGRFENYLETLPPGSAAVSILQRLVVESARAVEAFVADLDLAVPEVCDRMIVALSKSTLVEARQRRVRGPPQNAAAAGA